MKTPKEVYQEKVQRLEKALKKQKKQLLQSSLLRLTVFGLIIFGIYIFWGKAVFISLTLLVGITLFLFLISRHTRLQREKDKLIVLIQINQTELAVLKGDFDNLPEGNSYKAPLHAFAGDIDLFGKHSFFQYLNRTALPDGEKLLAHLFLENSTEDILSKQKAIKELKTKTDFRQHFTAIARLTQKENQEDTAYDLHKNLERLKNHTYFTPKYTRTLSLLFSGISLLLILSYFLNIIPGVPVLIWLFIGITITGTYIKKVNIFTSEVGNMQIIFRQYAQLLSLIEEEEFTTDLLTQQQKKMCQEGENASSLIREFSKTIDALDQRGNLLFGFLGNGFLLWDLLQSYKLEKWLKTHFDQVDEWFSLITFLDAYNSLGNFVFNHPQYTFPSITANNFTMKVEGAVHPLIPETEAVTNDFEIRKDEFFIITGANMAGKSTFLRTVALQILMSNLGLPVRATSCEYTPIKLITSMRTSDSLAEEASYFYAELSRLKYIIEQLKTERYFIVLDEILKGTNSKDKAMGSRKFLTKLVAAHSTGIIATHDLSLCEVSKELPEVKNHYFDAQIIEDELFFDYKFKPGVCQNMNASFLLKKMKIIDA